MPRRTGGFIGHRGLQAPDPPTAVTPTAGNTEVSVAFTAPSDVGDDAITGFVVQVSTSTGNYSAGSNTGSSSPIVVSSLTNDTAATAKVWAINDYGTSAPSDASVSFTPSLGPIGLIAGGASGSSGHQRRTEIQYVAIASTGNSADWGDLTVARWGLASGSSTTRAVFAYGEDGSGTNQNVIDYVSLSSAGNASDFGDMGATKNNSAGASNGTLAVFSRQNFSAGAYDYVTIASTGNSSSWGTSTRINEVVATCASPTYGYWCGGDTATNVIEYLTWSSAGNGADWGDLTAASHDGSGCSSNTRGCINLGYVSSSNVNTIDYFALSSTGNASDFGNLTSAIISIGESTSNKIRGIFAGGYTTAYIKSIDYITIASTGNASDFGDLTIKNAWHASTSDSHGGIA
tara:strand:+ start:1 stop:1209 length:1209 start_codon:yes stop_codon:yes gene_type:complete